MQALLHSMPPALKQATANPCLHRRLLDTHGHVWSVSCGITDPFSWVLVSRRFCLCPPKGLMPYPGLLPPEPLCQATEDLYLYRRHSDTVLITKANTYRVFMTLTALSELYFLSLTLILLGIIRYQFYR